MAETEKTYPDGSYFIARVKVVAEIGPTKYLPRDEMRAKGSLLNKIVAKYGENAIAYANPA